MSQHKPKKMAWRKQRTLSSSGRMRVLHLVVLACGAVLILRLGWIQIAQHGTWEALASGQRELYQELFPERGDILAHDGPNEEKPLATNRYLYLVWADPRRIDDPEATGTTLAQLLNVQSLDTPEAIAALEVEPAEEGEPRERVLPSQERTKAIIAQLAKEGDPYEPIQRKVNDEMADAIRAAQLPGIHLLREQFRYYPEKASASHVTGFVSQEDDGTWTGKYGIEGALEEVLAGTRGFLFAERDTKGRWISVGTRHQQSAEDGADVLLTIDRTLQYKICSLLGEAVEKYEADKGSVVVLDPRTGAIRALCTFPDFDPNVFNEVESIGVYNNEAVFDAYEPGSVFKPIVMAAALDANAVTPATTYEDLGEVKIDQYTIRNSDLKAHGIQTMTGVLEDSLNTGMIFVMRQLGMDAMARAVHAFRFGERTGIQIETEVAGNVDNVDKNAEIYSATISYGQGLTVTLLQLAQAYGALAHGGQLVQPYIVDEIRYLDGRVEKTEPKMLERVITAKTAQTITAMLVSVVESGHANLAAVPGYYIAGKTGTAQVANESGVGYRTDKTIASFVGYGPARDPSFVIAVRLDHPRTSPWAASTSAPTFGEMARFLLQYDHVTPER